MATEDRSDFDGKAISPDPRPLPPDNCLSFMMGKFEARIPVDQPHVVLLTNLLPENLLGLGDLLYTGLVVGRTAPVRVYGPAGTAGAIEGLRTHLGPGLAALTSALGLPAEGARIEAIEVGDGFEVEEDGARLKAGALGGGLGHGRSFGARSRGGQAAPAPLIATKLSLSRSSASSRPAPKSKYQP